MNQREREAIKKAMSIIGSQPKTMTEAALSQRRAALANVKAKRGWPKGKARKPLATK
jgi:hypothetical protein